MKSASEAHTVYTIGHSTWSMGDFLGMLQSFDIEVLIDIRRFPGSRKYPQFDSERLSSVLGRSAIEYRHMESLGGRRKVRHNSVNDRWRNVSFRAYADYMETEAFEEAIGTLQSIASARPTVYMCSEAVWWRCHRALVSDYLKAKGWTVRHIMAVGKSEEHPYTSAARVVGDKVLYSDTGLFSPE